MVNGNRADCLISMEANTTVKCKQDGKVVKNVRAHLVRLRKIEKRKKPSGVVRITPRRRRRSE